VGDQLGHGRLGLLDHRGRLDAADRVRDGEAVELRQPALDRLQPDEFGELIRADDDGRDAFGFQEDGGVDTPRRAGPSVG
jgi:hypothetical protein